MSSALADSAIAELKRTASPAPSTSSRSSRDEKKGSLKQLDEEEDAVETSSAISAPQVPWRYKVSCLSLPLTLLSSFLANKLSRLPSLLIREEADLCT